MRRARVSLLVCCVMSAGVAGAVAPPALALTDEIAYGCDLDICLVQPDVPGGVTNLTDNGPASIDTHPAWSPDGTRVAFVSTFGGGVQNVFVMQPDAPGDGVNIATQLTHYTVNSVVLGLAWSRDGTKVAYERNSGVSVVAADGTTVTPLVITPLGVHPTWSADSTKIAFSKGEQVFLAPADGGGAPAPLENGAGHAPQWSPDGAKIAFDKINATDPFVDLHVVNAGGGGTPVITPIPYSQWTFAAWSADSSKIAYRYSIGSYGQIRVVRADGTQDTPLASVDLENEYTPSWSPEGTRVTFQGVLGREIYVVAADGSGSARAVTTGGKNADPAWRPDPSRTPPTLGVPAPGPAPAAPAATPLPGPVQKPTVVWITKRIPWTPSRPIFVGAAGCSAPVCSVNSVGTAKGATTGYRAAHGAAKKKRRPKVVVVGRGHVEVPGGATRRIELKVTRAGAALLRARGDVTLSVTVTTTSPGQPATIARRQVKVRYVKPAGHRRRH